MRAPFKLETGIPALPSVQRETGEIAIEGIGTLEIRIEVPRAGTSHRFVKPLVIDEQTVVSFRYRRR